MLAQLASVFVIAGIVFGIKYLAETVHLFPVEQVRIEGEFIHLDKNKIEREISDVASGGFFDIDIATVREKLISMQWIEDAFVRREWPSSVVIRVVEKKPVARWNNRGILTDSGELFYPEKTQLTEQLAELEGPEGRYVFVLAEFNKIQSQLYQADITVTKLTQNSRRSWKMMVDGIEINLGRKNIYKKIENFASVYQTLLKPKLNTIERIDFRYTNGFAVKWKKGMSKLSDAGIDLDTYQRNMNQNLILGAV